MIDIVNVTTSLASCLLYHFNVRLVSNYEK